jgi:hypothetical protein
VDQNVPGGEPEQALFKTAQITDDMGTASNETVIEVGQGTMSGQGVTDQTADQVKLVTDRLAFTRDAAGDVTSESCNTSSGDAVCMGDAGTSTSHETDFMVEVGQRTVSFQGGAVQIAVPAHPGVPRGEREQVLFEAEQMTDSTREKCDEVVEKLSGCNFRLQIEKKTKVFHANLMKTYKERPASLVAAIIVEDSDTSVPESDSIPHPGLKSTESVDDVIINPELTASDARILQDVVAEYAEIFTDKPGKTSLCEFTVSLRDYKRVRKKPYAKQEPNCVNSCI